MQTTLFAVGSRKTATAKVWLTLGSGEIKINNRPAKDYLGREDLLKLINLPFKVVGLENQYNVIAKVQGGGISAQAGAIALGIARALVLSNEELRKPLKDAGLLKRDPREKERMKYGLAKRRKSFQWTKR
ncbi:MAG: 30S ribosomal protein S9 [candidate division WOR-3 bacterium]|nr:30S ribosomal protein S9 [candidate division WOR-3 bacterium]MCX7757700.1 30S ribosomal protein S9 [candidate division WOR-3 bacterium]MDW7987436.1 30S ribosomal protein S9 [candidate division WOR-3 bacterium]